MGGSGAERIKRHAGLVTDDGDAPTVAAAMARADAAEIDTATEDLLDALAVFNHELNGVVPSAGGDEQHDAVPRDLAYAVGEAARMLRDAGATRRAWELDTAWLAVLAGDIDDLKGHVALERASRHAD
jgi:hypothetical protein